MSHSEYTRANGSMNICTWCNFPDRNHKECPRRAKGQFRKLQGRRSIQRDKLYLSTKNKQSKNTINKNFIYNTIKKEQSRRIEQENNRPYGYAQKFSTNGIKSAGRCPPRNVILILHRKMNRWDDSKKGQEG